MKNTRTLACLAIIAASVILPVMTATHAEAGRRGGGGPSFVEKDFTVPKGARGHTGFIAGGAYCDYVRKPNRRCVITRSGAEKCTVVNYTLTQTCYR